MTWKAVSIYEARKWMEIIVLNSSWNQTTTFFEYLQLVAAPVPAEIHLGNIESCYKDKFNDYHIFCLATVDELVAIAQLYANSYCTIFTKASIPDRRVKILVFPGIKVNIYCSPQRRIAFYRQG